MSGEEALLRGKCSHVDCGREHRIWLPETIGSSDDSRANGTGKSDVSLHHWCMLCGCIQNISDDRPKKIGLLDKCSLEAGARISSHRLSETSCY